MKVTDDKRRIKPIHMQFNPTNLCNFSCSFCSCANRKRDETLSWNDTKDILMKFALCGCKTITITGGGEPLTYPYMSNTLKLCSNLGIKVGLVTNGTYINTLSGSDLSKITWIRISSSDNLESNLEARGNSIEKWLENIRKSVKIGDKVDWSFSYVITKNPDYDILAKIINFANVHRFTHVRIVSDLFDLYNVPDMERVKIELTKHGIDDSEVIYQGRKNPTMGSKKCLISLLKPVVGPDGKIYPCCGTQYALAKPGRDYEKSMQMGDAKDIVKIYENQKNFDGSVCVKCYYDQYNYALGVITSDIKHKEFV